MTTKIVCSTFKNFKAKEIETAQKGLRWLEEWLNTDFKNEVLKETFTGSKLTSEQVASRIISGSDDMNERVDYEINVAFSMYYRWWSHVVGFFNFGVRMINCNRKYFNFASEFGANAIHEYTHMAGFSHSSASEFASVPYKIGNMFLFWCKKKGYR